MFSANENLVLRQDKRRIVGYVEECIPDDVLNAGTTTLVMQVSCKAPGCVPLETVICVVFPRIPGDEDPDKELLPGLVESKNGGTYKTKVLKPMAEVTKQDVLESLPPEFPGGLRSTEKLCLQARDVMLAQITQLMGDDDFEGKMLMAAYLQQCLKEFVDRDCVPPEYGEPFPEEKPNIGDTRVTEVTSDNDRLTNGIIQSSGNFVVRRAGDDDKESPKIFMAPSNQQQGNTVVHRLHGKEDHEPGSVTATVSSTSLSSANSNGPSSMDWRRQQSVDRAMSSQSIISQLSARDHPPGVRRAGCPCCDPDHPNNYVDSMMML
jgi:hypothetical protein